MEKIKEFVSELNLENGANYKQAILRKYKDDDEVKYFLQYYFDPFKVTNISSKKISKRPGTYIEARMIKDWKDFLSFLVNECSGKDKDIKAIQNFIQFNKEHATFLKEVATKTIKMGISAKTLNECYGANFVPEVKIQLAAKYFDHKDKVDGKIFSISLKLDGIRCIARKEGQKVSLIARSGKPILDCEQIENELLSIPHDFVFDGEIEVEGYKQMESKAAYKRVTEIVKTQGPKHGLVLVVFDCLTIEEWESRIGKYNYDIRISNAKAMTKGLKYVQRVPRYYKGDDVAKIDEFLEKAKEAKQEGIMLNLIDVYQFCRTTSLLKVKTMQDCDLKVIGVQEGKGKCRGMLGALVVEYKGNTINVGSGLSDVLRNKIWNNQKAIIGRVIKVQYFEETKDAQGNKSLRFPVFLEVCEKGKKPSLH